MACEKATEDLKLAKERVQLLEATLVLETEKYDTSVTKHTEKEIEMEVVKRQPAANTQGPSFLMDILNSVIKDYKPPSASSPNV